MSPLDQLHAQRPSGHIRLIALLLLIAATLALGYGMRYTLSCFLLSFVIAYLFDPLIVYLEQRGIRRLFGIVLLYIVMAILTAFALTVLLPKLVIGWDSFLTNLPQYLLRTKQLLLSWQSRLPSNYGSAEISWLVENLTDNADAVIQKGGVWVYNFGRTMFFNLFNLVLSPILVFFILYYKERCLGVCSSWLPPSRRSLLLQIGNEIDASIGGYLRGQIMVSIIVALCTAPALWLLGVPHPLFCGIFAGLASILPFVGVIIAMLPALFFAWLAIGTAAILLKVIAVFAVIYFIEGYLIKPLVFKESMNLNPLLTIIMVMAFGELLGFWGIMLALPITAALKIAWEHWLQGDFTNHRNEP